MRAASSCRATSSASSARGRGRSTAFPTARPWRRSSRPRPTPLMDGSRRPGALSSGRFAAPRGTPRSSSGSSSRRSSTPSRATGMERFARRKRSSRCPCPRRGSLRAVASRSCAAGSRRWCGLLPTPAAKETRGFWRAQQGPRRSSTGPCGTRPPSSRSIAGARGTCTSPAHSGAARLARRARLPHVSRRIARAVTPAELSSLRTPSFQWPQASRPRPRRGGSSLVEEACEGALVASPRTPKPEACGLKARA